jgi:hypothetical protein
MLVVFVVLLGEAGPIGMESPSICLWAHQKADPAEVCVGQVNWGCYDLGG